MILFKKILTSSIITYFFYLHNGIYYSKYILTRPYINTYLFISFICISLYTQFLRGTTYRDGIMISSYIYNFTKFIFFLLLFNNFLFIISNTDSDNYYLVLPFYLPIYLDGAEYTGEYKVSFNSLVKSIIIQLFSFYKFDIISDGIFNINLQYIICAHPHGLIPIGVLNLMVNSSKKVINLNLQLEKDNTTYCVGASSNFFIPIIREIYLLMGMIDCSRPIIENLLIAKKNIAVITGGAQEANYSTSKKSILIVKKRKGIFELALKYGITLIPIYTFGENEIFEAWNTNIFILFKYITGLILPIGYFTFKRPHFISIIGQPLSVEKKLDYTLDDVDKLRELYCERLIILFNKYKHLNENYKNLNLEII